MTKAQQNKGQTAPAQLIENQPETDARGLDRAHQARQARARVTPRGGVAAPGPMPPCVTPYSVSADPQVWP